MYLHHDFWDGLIYYKHSYIKKEVINGIAYNEIHHQNGLKFYFSERNGQLFFIQGNQKERLLFDKITNIGDFWFIEPPDQHLLFPFLVEVIDTSSVLINGIHLKNWELKYTPWDSNSWKKKFDVFIERMGSINRYIDPYDDFLKNGADAGIGGELICYSDDEIL